jgi:hypothetical protein
MLEETTDGYVTTIAYYENVLYYGTSTGDIVRCFVGADAANPGQFLVRGHVKIGTGKRIDQLAVILPLRALLTLSAGRLTLRSLEDPSVDVSEVASEREATLFAVEEASTTEEGAARGLMTLSEGPAGGGARGGGRGGSAGAGPPQLVRIALASRRRLILLEWAHQIRQFVVIRELGMPPEAPMSLAWVHGRIWAGYSREYNFQTVRVTRGTESSEVAVGDVVTVPLYLSGTRPTMLAHPRGVVLVGEHKVGLRLQPNGNTETAATLRWSVAPTRLLWSNPYVVSVSATDASLEVHSFPDGAAVQRLDLVQATGAAVEEVGAVRKLTGKGSNCGVVCGTDGGTTTAPGGRSKKPIFLGLRTGQRRSVIVRVQQAPLEQQRERLLRLGASERAEALLELEAQGEGASPQRTQDAQRRLAVDAGRTHFLRLEFDRAREYLCRRPMPIDPLELASLFPLLRWRGFVVRPKYLSPSVLRAIVQRWSTPGDVSTPNADARPTDDPEGAPSIEDIVRAVVAKRRELQRFHLHHPGGPSADAPPAGSAAAAAAASASASASASAAGGAAAGAGGAAGAPGAGAVPKDLWEFGPLREVDEKALVRQALECVCDVLLTRRTRDSEAEGQGDDAASEVREVTAAAAAASTAAPGSALPSSAGPGAGAAAAAAAAASRAAAGSSASAAVRAAFFDVVLMRCLALTKRTHVLDSFLADANTVDLGEAERFLTAQGLYHSLARLWSARGEVRSALTMWRKLGTGELREEGHDGVAETIAVLRKCDSQDLVLQFARWVLEKDPTEGMKIFTAPQRAIALSPDAVLAFLRDPSLESALARRDASPRRRPLSLQFLTCLVRELGSQDPGYHTRLARELIALIRAVRHTPPAADPSALTVAPVWDKDWALLTPGRSAADAPATAATAVAGRKAVVDSDEEEGEEEEEEEARKGRAGAAAASAGGRKEREEGEEHRESLRRELLEHLQSSRHYSETDLLPDLEDAGLWEELVVVLGRAHAHLDAIDVLLHRLFDLRGAEMYAQANDTDDGSNPDSPFGILTRLLFTEPSPLLRWPFREFGLELIRDHPTKVSTTHVLSLIPSEMPLAALAGFLSHRVPAAADARRTMRARVALQSARHVTVNAQLSRRQMGYMIMRRDTRCAVSGEMIGDSVFVVLPDMRPVLFKHYLHSDNE